MKFHLDTLPPNAARLPYAFGAPLREAAEPLALAIGDRLIDKGDEELREASKLKAIVALGFEDRRHRAADNYEPVVAAAIQQAVELADYAADKIVLTVKMRRGVSRPGTTILFKEAAQ